MKMIPLIFFQLLFKVYLFLEKIGIILRFSLVGLVLYLATLFANCFFITRVLFKVNLCMLRTFKP